MYVRISQDSAGQGLGVQRQEQDCRARAASLGWSVEHLYSDNDVSATRSASRPAYEQMVSDIRAGEIDAVVVYNLDRLTRKPTELEDFIALAEQQGTRLANVSGDVDLTTANGKMVARMMGAMARAETDRLSERVSRQRLQAVQMGKPLGGRYRLFGYSKDWGIVPDEAVIVRTLFEKHINGHNMMSLFRWFSEQTNGVFPPTGKQVYYGTVKGLLQNPRYAALQPHRGQTYKGNWSPIVDEATFNSAQALFTGKKMPKGHNTRKTLLPGFLYCGLCDAVMQSRPATKSMTATYTCRECYKVSYKREWLDDVILREVALRQRRSRTKVSETVDYQPEIDALNTRIDELRAGYQRGELQYADYAEPLGQFRKQLAALESAQAEQEADRKQQTWFKNYKELLSADLSEQRTFIGQHIRAIRVAPARRLGGQKKPDLHRLTVSWVDGYDENLGERQDTHDAHDAMQDDGGR